MYGIVAYKGKNTSEINSRVRDIQKKLNSTVQSIIVDDVLLCSLNAGKRKQMPYLDKKSGIASCVDGYFRTGYDGRVYDNLSKRAVELYVKHGAEFIKNISGEFVISIYDSKMRKLVICNDRFAIRPFYTAENESEFMAASGPRYIVKSGFMRPVIDKTFVLNYLILNKFRLSDCTIFKGIKILGPATVRTLLKGKIFDKKYWFPFLRFKCQ